MKRLLLIILTVLVIFLIGLYLFIPNRITIQKNVFVSTTRDGLSRKLYDERLWSQWWPGKVKNGNSAKSFQYNNSSFTIDKLTIAAIFISISKDNKSVPTALNIFGKTVDTTQLVWSTEVPTSYNPIQRLQTYFTAKRIGNDMDAILEKIQSYFSKTENVYDYKINRGFVVDSFLVSTFSTSKSFPSMDFTYNLIDRVKKYIADNGAKEAGYPMLNVSTNDSISFLTRVAIPVDRIIPSSKEVAFKRMPAGGNMLVADVQGGPATMNKALHQTQNFISDYHEAAPAIPYFSLITDRRKEKDTSKWLTKIYYPVM